MAKESMAGTLDQLVEKFTKALGTDVVSIVLYGSAAGGNHHEGFSDYNVLCVLREITPEHLGIAEPVFRWWREQGNPSPLLLTEAEVRTSTDCFAIEFHDIRDSHRILYGADVVSQLEIDNAFYRGQVERELRAKLLRLRQKAAGILSDKAALGRLMADSVSTFCILFRHALILHGAAAPSAKREIVERVGQEFGVDGTSFLKLLAFRESGKKTDAAAKEFEPELLLGSYIKEIGKVIGAVDAVAK